MNLTNLRASLTAHAEARAPRHDPQAWLPAIERKAHRIRRLRTAGAVAATVLVVASVAAGPRLADLFADDRPDRTTEQIRLLDSFPEYTVGRHFMGATSGTRLVASEVADIAERSVSVTVSGRRELAMAFVCDTPGELTLMVKITVADREYMDMDLCPRPEPEASAAPEILTDSATLGDPVTFTLTVLNATNMDSSASETLPVPEEGSLALAIYETVPFEAYEFPPRPETLKPLLDPVAEADRQAYELDHIASRPDDPLAPQRIELIMPDRLWLEVIMQTPGRLHLVVNGREAGVYESFDYEAVIGDWVLPPPPDQPISGLELTTGETLVIEIVPEGLTGQWRVGVSEPPAEPDEPTTTPECSADTCG